MMTIKFISLILVPLCLCLTGCDFLSNAISDSWHSYKDKSEPFYPPQENQWITVEGIAPKNTTLELSGDYISNKCLSTYGTASMNIYKKPSHHWDKINISINPTTGYFKKKIPFHGGGWCQWKINAISLSLFYTDVDHLIKGAVSYYGTGIYAIINEAEQTQHGITEAFNTIDYRPVIYPFLRKDYDKANKIGLYGESGRSKYFRLRLKSGNEWKITYMPTLDETKMPKIIISENPPEVYPRGNARVEYPDGKVDLDSDYIEYWKINNTSQWESK
ncbi:hypothetical protein [Xenorhabdus bovienii]|uniref:Lipoprotein n=1 Tax=Xenorhabdus bovienii str. Intermedium TaxID=1379677 RepID=A0A077QP83_XENBV|nr:hypothetical protein [Xenorhabdus bovienii]CDH35255.1 conserved exported hypothetical protein [Xenorhabdus bovienii str. Intermedium]